MMRSMKTIMIEDAMVIFCGVFMLRMFIPLFAPWWQPPDFLMSFVWSLITGAIIASPLVVLAATYKEPYEGESI